MTLTANSQNLRLEDVTIGRASTVPLSQHVDWRISIPKFSRWWLRCITRTRYYVFFFWFVVVLHAFVFGFSFLHQTTSSNPTVPGSDAERANDILERHFPQDATHHSLYVTLWLDDEDADIQWQPAIENVVRMYNDSLMAYEPKGIFVGLESVLKYPGPLENSIRAEFIGSGGNSMLLRVLLDFNPNTEQTRTSTRSAKPLPERITAFLKFARMKIRELCEPLIPIELELATSKMNNMGETVGVSGSASADPFGFFTLAPKPINSDNITILNTYGIDNTIVGVASHAPSSAHALFHAWTNTSSSLSWLSPEPLDDVSTLLTSNEISSLASSLESSINTPATQSDNVIRARAQLARDRITARLKEALSTPEGKEQFTREQRRHNRRMRGVSDELAKERLQILREMQRVADQEDMVATAADGSPLELVQFPSSPTVPTTVSPNNTDNNNNNNIKSNYKGTSSNNVAYMRLRPLVTSWGLLHLDTQSALVHETSHVFANVIPLCLLAQALFLDNLRSVAVTAVTLPTSLLAVYFWISLFSPSIPIPSFSPPVIAAFVFAGSFNYVISILWRLERELRRGTSVDFVHNALLITMATTGQPLIVAAFFFSTILLTLLIFPAAFLQSSAFTLISAVVITLAVHMTLLPSMILTFPFYFARRSRFPTPCRMRVKLLSCDCCTPRPPPDLLAQPAKSGAPHPGYTGYSIGSYGYGGFSVGSDHTDHLASPMQDQYHYLATNVTTGGIATIDPMDQYANFPNTLPPGAIMVEAPDGTMMLMLPNGQMVLPSQTGSWDGVNGDGIIANYPHNEDYAYDDHHDRVNMHDLQMQMVAQQAGSRMQLGSLYRRNSISHVYGGSMQEMNGIPTNQNDMVAPHTSSTISDMSGTGAIKLSRLESKRRDSDDEETVLMMERDRASSKLVPPLGADVSQQAKYTQKPPPSSQAIANAAAGIILGLTTGEGIQPAGTLLHGNSTQSHTHSTSSQLLASSASQSVNDPDPSDLGTSLGRGHVMSVISADGHLVTAPLVPGHSINVDAGMRMGSDADIYALLNRRQSFGAEDMAALSANHVSETSRPSIAAPLITITTPSGTDSSATHLLNGHFPHHNDVTNRTERAHTITNTLTNPTGVRPGVPAVEPLLYGSISPTTGTTSTTLTRPSQTSMSSQYSGVSGRLSNQGMYTNGYISPAPPSVTVDEAGRPIGVSYGPNRFSRAIDVDSLGGIIVDGEYRNVDGYPYIPPPARSISRSRGASLTQSQTHTHSTHSETSSQAHQAHPSERSRLPSLVGTVGSINTAEGHLGAGQAGMGSDEMMNSHSHQIGDNIDNAFNDTSSSTSNNNKNTNSHRDNGVNGAMTTEADDDMGVSAMSVAYANTGAIMPPIDPQENTMDDQYPLNYSYAYFPGYHNPLLSTAPSMPHGGIGALASPYGTTNSDSASSGFHDPNAPVQCCGGCCLCLWTRKRCLLVSKGYTSCFEDVYHSCILSSLRFRDEHCFSEYLCCSKSQGDHVEIGGEGDDHGDPNHLHHHMKDDKKRDTAEEELLGETSRRGSASTSDYYHSATGGYIPPNVTFSLSRPVDLSRDDSTGLPTNIAASSTSGDNTLSIDNQRARPASLSQSTASFELGTKLTSAASGLAISGASNALSPSDLYISTLPKTRETDGLQVGTPRTTQGSVTLPSSYTERWSVGSNRTSSTDAFNALGSQPPQTQEGKVAQHPSTSSSLGRHAHPANGIQPAEPTSTTTPAPLPSTSSSTRTSTRLPRLSKYGLEGSNTGVSSQADPTSSSTEEPLNRYRSSTIDELFPVGDRGRGLSALSHDHDMSSTILNPYASGPTMASIRRFFRCYWCACCHPSEEDQHDEIGRQLKSVNTTFDGSSLEGDGSYTDINETDDDRQGGARGGESGQMLLESQNEDEVDNSYLSPDIFAGPHDRVNCTNYHKYILADRRDEEAHDAECALILDKYAGVAVEDSEGGGIRMNDDDVFAYVGGSVPMIKQSLTSAQILSARHKQNASLWYKVARRLTTKAVAFPFLLIFLLVTVPVAMQSRVLETTADIWLIHARENAARVELRSMAPTFPQSRIFPQFIVQTGPSNFVNENKFFEFCYIFVDNLLSTGAATLFDIDSVCITRGYYVSFEEYIMYQQEGDIKYDTYFGHWYRYLLSSIVNRDRSVALIRVRAPIDTMAAKAAEWKEVAQAALDKAAQFIGSRVDTIYAGGITLYIDASSQLGQYYGAQVLIILISVFVVAIIFSRTLFAPLKIIITAGVSLSWVAGLSEIVFQEKFARHFLPTMDHLSKIYWIVPVLAIVTLIGYSFQFELVLHLSIFEFRKMGYSDRASILKSMYTMGGVTAVTALTMCANFAALLGCTQGVLNQLGFVIFFALILDAFVITLLLSPTVKSLVGTGLWWPMSVGPHMMDSSYFAELEPYDPAAYNRGRGKDK